MGKLTCDRCGKEYAYGFDVGKHNCQGDAAWKCTEGEIEKGLADVMDSEGTYVVRDTLASIALTEYITALLTRSGGRVVTREKLIGILHAHWATGGGELGELHQLFVPKPIAEIMADRIEDAILTAISGKGKTDG